jgi:hypothetical protein
MDKKPYEMTRREIQAELRTIDGRNPCGPEYGSPDYERMVSLEASLKARSYLPTTQE